MKPIRILSPQLDILAEIDDYQSLIFTRRYHRVGEFSLVINRYKQHTDKLQKGNLILLGGETHKVGIIKYREIQLDESGKVSENWIISGYTLEGIALSRVILPPSGMSHDEQTAAAETIMKHYVDACLVNPGNPDRKIDLIQIATDQARGQSLTWKARYSNLAEDLEKISLACGLGWQMSLDITNKKWTFDVLQGRDLTTSQSTNPPVIFSTDFETIKAQHYIDSDLNYRNVGYVGGQGENELREIAEVGTATGLNRIETFIDARDMDDSTALSVRGQQKLDEMKTEQYLEGQILTNGPFLYELDFDLGDIVTVQNSGWGVAIDTRIVDVTETYEPSNKKIDVTVGQSVPTLISKIKQELSQMSAEVRR